MEGPILTSDDTLTTTTTTTTMSLGMGIEEDDAWREREKEMQCRREGLATILQSARDRYPNSFRVLFARGLFFLRNREFELARQELISARDALQQTQSQCVFPQANRFTSLFSQVDAHIARAEWELALLAHEEDDISELLENARRRYTSAIEIDAKNTAAWGGLALANFAFGQFSEASSSLTSVVRTFPGHIDALTNLGLVYFSTHQIGEANAIFKTNSERVQPHSPNAINQSAILLVRNEFESALSLLDSALEDDPDNPMLLNNMGIALRHLKRYDEAESVLYKACSLETNYLLVAHYRLNIATCLLAHGSSDSATIILDKILSEGPENTRIYASILLGKIALLQREDILLRYGPGTDADEKSHCAQQAFLQATDKLHDYVDAWLQLGILSLTEGAYDRAQNFLKQAIFHDCSSAEAWCNLGITSHLNGELGDAESVYLKSVSLCNSDKVYNNIAILHRQQGLFEKAIQDIERSLRLRPDSAIGYNNLGLIYVGMGDNRRALNAFRTALELDPTLLCAKSNLMKVDFLDRYTEINVSGTPSPVPVALSSGVTNTDPLSELDPMSGDARTQEDEPSSSATA